MCGRFSLRARLAELLDEFSIGENEVSMFEARYNIAPSQAILVVREITKTSSPAREAAWLRWGLIPAWESDPASGNRMINARSETAAQKPAFREAMGRRRCLIVADGFYEWKTEGRTKQPYFIHFADDRPFAFAGLWENWEAPDRSRIESCAILTTEANELVHPIHDRMPVILHRNDYSPWLDTNVRDSASLRTLLVPYAGKDMEAFPVGRSVNNPRFEGAECLMRAKSS
jgi:putative SOS response-associated peptidase YedK